MSLDVEMALKDEDNLVREWASATLGHYPEDRELTPLPISLLADPDWHVSSGAATGLRGLGDPSALPALQARLRDLRKSPLRWYRFRLSFKEAIAALRKLECEGPDAPRPRHSAARDKSA
jgi:HEAT repeat protein